MEGNIFTEALDSPKLVELIRAEIIRIRKKRSEAVLNSKVARLRSDAFSALHKSGMLEPGILISEFILVLAKQSALPAREREWVTSFMDYVIANTAIYLKQQQATVPAEEKPKRKPNPKKLKA